MTQIILKMDYEIFNQEEEPRVKLTKETRKIIEKDLGLHYIKFDENRNKITDHNYVLLNERVRDIVVSQDRKTIILFLETSGSMAIIKKIR